MWDARARLEAVGSCLALPVSREGRRWRIDVQVNAKAGQVRARSTCFTRCSAVTDCARRVLWGRSGRARGWSRRPKEHLELPSRVAAPALGARGARHAGPVALATFLLRKPVRCVVAATLVGRLWLWCGVQAGVEASKFTMVMLFVQEKTGEKAKLRGRSRAPVSSLLVVSGTAGNRMKPSVHLSHSSSLSVFSSSLSSPCRSASFSVAAS